MIKATIAGLLLASQILLISTAFSQPTTASATFESPFKNLSLNNPQDREKFASSLKQMYEKIPAPRFDSNRTNTLTVYQPSKSVNPPLPCTISAWTVNVDNKVIFDGYTYDGTMLQQQAPKISTQPAPCRTHYHREHTNSSQIWLIPVKENASKITDWAKIKNWLMPPRTSKHEYHRQMIYMGTDGDYAWYGYMPVSEFLCISKELNLRGGEDKIQLAINAMLEHDNEGILYVYLNSHAAELPPYLDKMIVDFFPARTEIIYHLTRDNPKLVEWLTKHVDSIDAPSAEAAKNNLLQHPRKAAIKFYRTRIENNFEYSVQPWLMACMRLNVPGLDEYCRQICKYPMT